MAQHEDHALVLDIKDYRETSSLLRVFTRREGRISLVGRGLRKSKSSTASATIQPFNLVKIRYYLKEGATIGNLGSADLDYISSAPRNSLEAYAIASYWFEILKETSQAREAVEDIFNLTVRVLKQQEETPGLTIEFLSELSLLCQYLGFGINWNGCVFCDHGNGEPAQFSITNGGVVCGRCAADENKGLTLKAEEKPVIAGLGNGAPAMGDEGYSSGALLDVLGIVNRYLVYHLEHPLKTFGFMETTLKW